MIDEAITELEPLVGTRKACQATGRPQANHYRRHRQSPRRVHLGMAIPESHQKQADSIRKNPR